MVGKELVLDDLVVLVVVRVEFDERMVSICVR